MIGLITLARHGHGNHVEAATGELSSDMTEVTVHEYREFPDIPSAADWLNELELKYVAHPEVYGQSYLGALKHSLRPITLDFNNGDYEAARVVASSGAILRANESVPQFGDATILLLSKTIQVPGDGCYLPKPVQVYRKPGIFSDARPYGERLFSHL